MKAVESETDEFPLGDVRQYWKPEDLQGRDVELDEYMKAVTADVLNACRRLEELLSRQVEGGE